MRPPKGESPNAVETFELSRRSSPVSAATPAALVGPAASNLPEAHGASASARKDERLEASHASEPSARASRAEATFAAPGVPSDPAPSARPPDRLDVRIERTKGIDPGESESPGSLGAQVGADAGTQVNPVADSRNSARAVQAEPIENGRDARGALSAEERRRAQKRGAALEREGAKKLGTRRTARIGSHRREPDLAPFRVRGHLLVAECKARSSAPAFIVRGLAQAKSYCRGAEPLLVLRPRGAPALIVLGLDIFVELAGIAPERLPTIHTPTRRAERDPQQRSLWPEEDLT